MRTTKIREKYEAHNSSPADAVYHARHETPSEGSLCTCMYARFVYTNDLGDPPRRRRRFRPCNVGEQMPSNLSLSRYVSVTSRCLRSHPPSLSE